MNVTKIMSNIVSVSSTINVDNRLDNICIIHKKSILNRGGKG